jgi:tetratricopeptide (TPR) repeat protein
LGSSPSAPGWSSAGRAAISAGGPFPYLAAARGGPSVLPGSRRSGCSASSVGDNRQPGTILRCSGRTPRSTNLGLAYADLGRLEESLDRFKLALDLLPHAPTSLQNYARGLAKLGFNREAIPHFREAIRLKPDFVTARNNMALTLLRLGDTQGAEDELNRVLQIAPDYADAHNNLGLVLLRTGRNSEAVPHFTKALQLQPGNIHAENNLLLARDAAKAHQANARGMSGDRQIVP